MGSAASRANREYYERLTAGQRDYWRKMAAPRHRLRTLLSRLEADAPGAVVDLGCGGGAMLEEIRDALPAARLAGVDIAESLIEENRRAHPGMSWHVLDLDRDADPPDELSGAFDAVVAMEVIEHVDHPDAFLRTAARLAAPGGRLYLSTQSGPMRETERRVGHRRHFAAAELAALLDRNGWEAAEVWNTGWPFHDLSKWYANLDPDGSMERFGERGYGPWENFVCWALRLAFRLNSRRRGAQLFAVATRS